MPSRTYFALCVIILPPITYALYRYSIGIIIPEFELAYSINDSLMGGIISASIGIVALGAFASSSAARKYGEQRTILLGLSIFSIPLISIGFSKTLLEFLFLFMLASLGGGLMTPPVYTVALSLLPKRRGTAVSIVTAAYNFGGLIGSPIVGYLLVHYSWNSSFLLIGFVGLGTLLAFLIFFRQERKLSFPKPRDGSSKIATRSNTLVVLMVANFFADLAFLTYVSWTPKFLNSDFGVGRESIATISTYFGIAVGVGAPGTLIIGALLDRLGGRKCAMINGVIVSLSMLGIYIANSLTLSIAMLMIAGFVANWYFTILTTMAQTTVPEENRTSAISLVQTSGFIGEFIGPGLAGLIGGAETFPLILTVVTPNLVYTGIMSLAFRSKDRKTTTVGQRGDVE